MRWTQWQDINESCEHSGPAIYRLRFIRISGDPFPISRFLGIDVEGTLSIGQTGNMEARRRQFVRAAKSGAGHSGGDLFFYLTNLTRLKKLITDHRVEFRFQHRPSKKSAIAEEIEQMKRYVCKFGEAPPLCSVISGMRIYLREVRKVKRAR